MVINDNKIIRRPRNGRMFIEIGMKIFLFDPEGVKGGLNNDFCYKHLTPLGS